MAKLSFERNVSPLVSELNTKLNTDVNNKFSMRDIDSGVWRLMKGNDEVYTGTLRECYCFISGMLYSLNN